MTDQHPALAAADEWWERIGKEENFYRNPYAAATAGYVAGYNARAPAAEASDDEITRAFLRPLHAAASVRAELANLGLAIVKVRP